MGNIDFVLSDKIRLRDVPVTVYFPESADRLLQVIIFSSGYQGQEDLSKPDIKLAYKNYEYLANYFTKINYAFISIQHDIMVFGKVKDK